MQYGQIGNDSEEFHMQYSDASFGKFLFSLGDFSKWLISSKDAVNNDFVSYNGSRSVIKSSLIPTSHSIWRTFNVELQHSPIISLIAGDYAVENSLFTQNWATGAAPTNTGA